MKIQTTRLFDRDGRYQKRVPSSEADLMLALGTHEIHYESRGGIEREIGVRPAPRADRQNPNQSPASITFSECMANVGITGQRNSEPGQPARVGQVKAAQRKIEAWDEAERGLATLATTVIAGRGATHVVIAEPGTLHTLSL